MMKRCKMVFFVLIIICVVMFIIVNNIELNRDIYCNDLHIKRSEENDRNASDNYNLDSMEKHLDALERESKKVSNKKDDFSMLSKVYVPKFRILYSTNPFDIRFETLNYKVYVNRSIAEAAINEKTYLYSKIRDYYEVIDDYMSYTGDDIGMLKMRTINFVEYYKDKVFSKK
ncbi:MULTISPECIES: hypothetical protein [Clostridium]|uniref:hypothetical protein n=1 Tax=Clostridium TaxID=1485 RepID=UPI000826F315|nr:MULTISPECIES: hypothetical protein [Clostridium]PJI10291.1 hypothetical protein CUB90_04085 [Clostridium sp. CT7]